MRLTKSQPHFFSTYQSKQSA